MHTWDPDRYLTYADERGRPFVELLARVDAADPATVVDLGCGPGNLTALLVERWPGARVVGLDSSPEMIEKGRLAASRTATTSSLRAGIGCAKRASVSIADGIKTTTPSHTATPATALAADDPRPMFTTSATAPQKAL